MSSQYKVQNELCIPTHLAIIMDGNTRWAMQRGLPVEEGHKRGVEVLQNVIEYCGKCGVKILTVFAFSSENWQRSADEVDHLMQLFAQTLETKLDYLIDQKISLRLIGDTSRLDPQLVSLINNAEQLTQNGEYQLVVAFNYGGKADVVQACASIAKQVAAGVIAPDAIDEALIDSHLHTAGLPPPDLCIRTSNEWRISNFMLWQLAYSELYFCDDLWPDFGTEQLKVAFTNFADRKRRFGASSLASS